MCGIHKGGSCANLTSAASSLVVVTVNRGFHKTGFGSLSEANGGGVVMFMCVSGCTPNE